MPIQTPKGMIMPPVEVRVALLRNSIAQAGIARDLGVSTALISRVIDGTSVSDRVRRAVAEAAGIDIGRIWPCYLPGHGGPPKKTGPRAKVPRKHPAA